MKSNLPTKVPNLTPYRVTAREALEYRQVSQKEYFYCRTAPDLRTLQPGQRVWILEEAGRSHTLEPAIVSRGMYCMDLYGLDSGEDVREIKLRCIVWECQHL